MKAEGATTLADGFDAWNRLAAMIGERSWQWTEADTRFQIINRLIEECLGWPPSSVRCERSLGRSYTDYELGSPRQVIWEAKREEHVFDLPAGFARKRIVDLASIMHLGGEVAGAIEQVQGYCSQRGVEIAVATNGHQIIAFLATRGDGVPPLQGRAMVWDGYDAISSGFAELWQSLSPAAVAEKRLHRLLTVGEDRSLPPKLSSYLLNYPRYRYPSQIQSSLRDIAEFILIDLVVQPDVEPQFLNECYCESGALSQHALISKNILSARYGALFDPSAASPALSPVTLPGGRTAFTPEVMAEALTHRPIVLVGDVGVGKSSFLKHLRHVSAIKEFREALYIYVDLGSRGALSADLRDFILTEISDQLYAQHGVDINESSFVRGVYDLDVKRFDRGIYGALKQTDTGGYNTELLKFLSERVSSVENHLKRAIDHISKARRQQIIVVLDNADQREDSVQERAFVIAQNLASDWKAAVFIAVRPTTFYHSKQSGALSAYPNRIFTISPPRVEIVMEKRLVFGLKIAEGKVKVETLKNIELNLASISLFLKALIRSLKQNDEIKEFLSNITGGNIREAVDLVVKFIGSPNVDAEKIVDIENGGRYIVPVHEFWKQALLGDFSYYDPQSSMAVNLFDLVTARPEEHFLRPIILSFLLSDGRHRSKEGFVDTDVILSELQNWSITPHSTESAIRVLNNKKLIETSERVTFAEDSAGLYGDMPTRFRTSTVGAYHIKRWISEFAYLDAVSCDTPILNADVKSALREDIDSHAIDNRLARAEIFRDYLVNCWRKSDLHPAYFNFPDCLKPGEDSFERVRRAVRRNTTI